MAVRFRGRGRGMIDLGTLGGTYSIAYRVNPSGLVVGGSNTAGDAEFHAVMWDARGSRLTEP